MKKIAFCFLIYDKINHEDLWNIFFKNIDKNTYNIYIHYKNNIPLQFFEEFKLKKCIETKWGDISLVKAQNILLNEALKDTDNQHFIFISNSCIPLKKFNYIYNNLNENYSYFNICKQNSCFPRCNDISKYIDIKYIQKSHQWCILNRAHTLLMVTKTEYIKWFENIEASDEHCYISNIFANNLENEIITTPNLSNDATTFTNWGDMGYKYESGYGVKNYSSISDEELSYLLNSKCLFGRKFNKECILNNEAFINSISSVNLIKINNVDCFSGQNLYSHIFTNEDECIQICIRLSCNVFVIYENTVYYRSYSIKECVMNLVKTDCIVDLYIYIPDNFNSYYCNIFDRIQCYTKGIYNSVIEYNTLKDDKKTINDTLLLLTSKDWFYQHHSNLLKFLKNESEDFKFEYNPYDNSESMDIPTFVKSRNKQHAGNSVLLPLEDLYIPSYYSSILNDDVSFNKKKKNCVWRGCNSGKFFTKNNNKGSRESLVLQYGKHPVYNIGLSYANYKCDNKINYNIEDYVKGTLSIKDQLEYMFIISVEGNDFATNLSWIMLSNSVPLMPLSYVETWKMESKLIPYIHYVPLNNNFSDLDEKMDWCINNLDKCEDIAFMSKLYILQFFDKKKEDNIIKEIIEVYKKNVINNKLIY